MNHFYLSIIAAFAHALTGTAAVSMRYLVNILDANEVAFLRYLIGSVFVYSLFLISKAEKVDKPYWTQSVLLGILFFGIFPYTFAQSFHYISAAKGALIIATMPVWAMVIAYLFGTETFDRKKLFAITLTITGLFIALLDKLVDENPHNSFYIGELLMIVTAVIGGFYSVLAKIHLKDVPAIRFTPIMMMSGFLFLAPWTVDYEFLLKLSELERLNKWVLLYVGVFTGGLAFYLFNWVIEKTSASYATLFVPMSPLTAMLIAPLLLDEMITVNFYLGAIIVFIGLTLGHKSLKTTSPTM